MAWSDDSALVLDLGGTFIRFGLYNPSTQPLIEHIRKFKVLDFPGIEEAMQSYLSDLGFTPYKAGLSVAGPAEEDLIVLVNHPWQFSLQALQARFGFDQLCALNDFRAIAYAYPKLSEHDLEPWHEGASMPHTARLVLGPGTGLGLAVLHQLPDDRWFSCPTEGGNIGFAPQTPLQHELLKWANRHLGARVFVEQFVSGPGLVNLANALSDVEGEPLEQPLLADQWVEQMLQADPFALRLLDCFAELLGAYAGDMVLAHGARGGVVLAGGLLPRLNEVFPREMFLAAFQDKGRYQPYLEAVPVHLCQHPEPGLLGAGEYIWSKAGAA
ncbi:MAG: glucokinase [Limnobacter sp.]|nr:glucokinase [Limnobacter sp.]